MAVLPYMKPSLCLPDPKVSMSVPSQAIAEVNREVQKAMQATKRGLYLQLSPSRCEIARNTPDTTEQQQQRCTTLETTSKVEKQFLVDGRWCVRLSRQLLHTYLVRFVAACQIAS